MFTDYYEAGFHIFGLQGVKDGVCECGNPQCENLYKHPRVSSWQHTPYWSEEQLDNMAEYGQFKTGFGVLCRGYLIIDIDPRNGGNESYDLLVKDMGMDFKKHAGFVVYTGGGGWHIYYRYDGEGSLLSHLKEYPGIDFKSSGFVVGCGSLHVSGMSYEKERGNPEDITDLPDCMREALTKKARITGAYTPSVDRVEAEKVAKMLSFIDSCIYELWIEMGMVCHNELGDDGLLVWDKWSQGAENYDSEVMQYKWHSFGKSTSVVTIATLIQKARDNGYQESVTFETELVNDFVPVNNEIDLSRPPGLVGECAAFINSCSRFPREFLAVSAALTAVSSIGGLRFEDEYYGVTPNLFTFNVAGSATGKEAIQQAHGDLLICAGLGATVYGTIKSEQEIYRNVGRHQPLNYLIDEFGILLNKIEQSSKGGAASYMGGVIGSLMSIYSKANGRLPLGADYGDDLRREIGKRASTLAGLKESHEAKECQLKELESLERLLMQLQDGYIDSPFLTLAGYTTPTTFNGLVSYTQATNGFIGRALIFEEKNNNPRSKAGFKRKGQISDMLAMKLKSLFNGGASSVGNSGRVEYLGAKQVITTSDDAIILLERIEKELHDKAATAMETNGLEAIVRRSFELVLKTSMILAMGDGCERTAPHVEWAYALVLRDMESKINLTSANMAEEESNLSEEILSKVKHKLDRKEGQTVGSIKNKMRSISKENIQTALEYMEANKTIICTEKKPKRGPAVKMYFLA